MSDFLFKLFTVVEHKCAVEEEHIGILKINKIAKHIAAYITYIHNRHFAVA